MNQYSNMASVIRRWNLAFIVTILSLTPKLTNAESPGPASTVADEQRIDEILTNLEKRSEGLTDIRCEVRFVEDDRINLSTGVKDGSILFQMAKPNPLFLVHFKSTQRDGTRGKQEWYLFDGEWFYQALERLLEVSKERIAEPGEQVDLFDVENAPFPLPFGQKKDKIRRNFEVWLTPPTETDPTGTDHLVCIPKPDSPTARRYDRLDFFVMRDVHLPKRIVVTKDEGAEVHTADFPNLSAASINAGVKKSDFEPPEVWLKDGYKVVVESEGTKP